jgi:glucuronokinase
MSPTVHSASCSARAAIAGNPSDGHGGAVVSTVVPAVAATVRIRRSDRIEIAGTNLVYGSLEELSERVGEEGCGDVQPLVPATLAVLHRHLDARLDPHLFEVRSTIPRSVGLAGSSAIVIATIRAMIAAHADAPWAGSLVAEPALLASLALAAEREVLGIAAGLQDRVVQTFGGTVAMEFDHDSMHTIDGFEVGAYRRLGTLPGGLFVAYRAAAATDSGQVHAAVDHEDPAVRGAMRRAAFAARAAVEAIGASDVMALGTAMDETFDQRASIMRLDPEHVEMIEVARTHGASANYTGSGGSVIVLANNSAARNALVALGCGILDL